MRFSSLFFIVLLYTFETFATVSLVQPKGWECIQDPEQLPQKIVRIYVGTGKGSFTPSINIAHEETKLTADEYIRQAKSYHENQSNSKCTQMGKIQTKAGTAHLIQIDSLTQYGNVRFIQAILIDHSNAYVITGTCLQEEFASLSSQFLKAIQSFSIQ